MFKLKLNAEAYSGERTTSTEERTYSREKGNMYEENDGGRYLSYYKKRRSTVVV